MNKEDMKVDCVIQINRFRWMRHLLGWFIWLFWLVLMLEREIWINTSRGIVIQFFIHFDFTFSLDFSNVRRKLEDHPLVVYTKASLTWIRSTYPPNGHLVTWPTQNHLSFLAKRFVSRVAKAWISAQICTELAQGWVCSKLGPGPRRPGHKPRAQTQEGPEIFNKSDYLIICFSSWGERENPRSCISLIHLFNRSLHFAHRRSAMARVPYF